LTEREITAGIRHLLKTLGVFHWKQHQGLGSTPGVPDIIGIWHGKLLGIEIKTTAGRVSEHQQRFIDAINREGGLAFVARSIDDVINGLGVKQRFVT
jgi:Holliday junction resolvase